MAVEEVSVSLEPDSSALPVPEEPKESPSGEGFLLYLVTHLSIFSLFLNLLGMRVGGRGYYIAWQQNYTIF